MKNIPQRETRRQPKTKTEMNAKRLMVHAGYHLHGGIITQDDEYLARPLAATKFEYRISEYETIFVTLYFF